MSQAVRERMYRDRVEAGIAMLDRRYPGWLNDVNLADLDLYNVRNCVLGQVARARGGNYNWELYKLTYPEKDLTNVHDIECDALDGFMMAKTQDTYGFGVGCLIEWADATQIWRERIAALKASRNPVPNPAVLV